MKKLLRIVAKKKRIKFKLGFKSKANLKNKIHMCLNKIFHTNKKIKTAGLYFPINNEISPFDFIYYLQKKK